MHSHSLPSFTPTTFSCQATSSPPRHIFLNPTPVSLPLPTILLFPTPQPTSLFIQACPSIPSSTRFSIQPIPYSLFPNPAEGDPRHPVHPFLPCLRAPTFPPCSLFFPRLHKQGKNKLGVRGGGNKINDLHLGNKKKKEKRLSGLVGRGGLVESRFSQPPMKLIRQPAIRRNSFAC